MFKYNQPSAFLLAIILYFSLVTSALSEGTDSYFFEGTDPYYALDVAMEDSTKVLNKQLNKMLSDVLDKASLRHTCSDISFRFAKQLERWVNPKNENHFFHWISQLEQDGKIEVFPRYETSDEDYFENSIYRDGPYFKLARIIESNGVHIGIDKLAIAFATAYTNYSRYRDFLSKDENISSKTEKELKSKMLRANFEDILSEERSIITFPRAALEARLQGLELILNICDRSHIKKGLVKWEIVKPINLRNYVNPMWDEVYNSSQIDEDTWPQVKKRIVEYCPKLQQENSAVASKFLLYQSRMSSRQSAIDLVNRVLSDRGNNLDFSHFLTLCKKYGNKQP